MENPRPEKVAVVAEVTEKLTGADAALLTEYRGMSVKAMSELRRALRPAGAEYKVYKNTLVRFAARNAGIEGADDILAGPVAIAFVRGDVAGAAKALRDYAKTNQSLVLKGGVLAGKVISASDVESLADLPPREVVLSQIAGLFEAPLSQMASLLEAVPREFAYGIQALIDKNGGEQAAA
jgi:large subunit ribosomal protein L10